MTGIAVAAAIAAKFSCIFVVPAIVLLMMIQPLSAYKSELPRTLRAYFRRWPPVGQMAAAVVVAFVTLWGTYFFNVDRMNNQTLFTTAGSAFLHLPVRIRNAEVPMPSFALGMMKLVAHNKSNNGYLNGRFSPTGWWYYFPETIALKEPIALLAGLLVAGLLLFVPAHRAHWWRLAVILIPPAILLAAAMTSSIDIGIRHVLPVLPFLYLFVCFQLTRAGVKGVAFLAVLIVTAMIESAWIAPNYLEFYNLIAGGPAHGARYLLDSNIDFGQDVAQLAEWLHSDQARGRSYSLRLFMFPDKSLTRALGLDPAALFRNPNGGGYSRLAKMCATAWGRGCRKTGLHGPRTTTVGSRNTRLSSTSDTRSTCTTWTPLFDAPADDQTGPSVSHQRSRSSGRGKTDSEDLAMLDLSSEFLQIPRIRIQFLSQTGNCSLRW